MATVLEITCNAGPDRARAVWQWCKDGPAQGWRSLPGMTALDRYLTTAGRASDPMVDDGSAGPLLMLMLEFPDRRALEAVARSETFARLMSALPPGVTATADAMERRFYSVAGETAAQPLLAPFSYSVRYRRPAENEAKFVEFYLANHPPLLARLPGVRNVICYLPLRGAGPTDLPGADYMLGNEVTFETVEAFNAAMASEQRLALRADFNRLPPFSGRDTHYPMDRSRLLG